MHPHSASRISLAGSLDPATGIFYRSPEHPRLRTAQACEKCRTRKAKCSGEHPTCKRCQSRGLVCEYAKEGRVRGPNKPKKTTASSEPEDAQLAAYANRLGMPPSRIDEFRATRPRPPNLNLNLDQETMEHYRLDGGFQLTPSSSSNLGVLYDYEYEYDYGLAHQQQLNALSHHHHQQQQQHGPRYRYAEEPGTAIPVAMATSTASVHAQTHPALSAYQGVHVHTPTASLSMDELGAYSFHPHEENNRSPSASSSTSIQGGGAPYHHHHPHHPPHFQSVSIHHHHPHNGPSSPSVLGHQGLYSRSTRESSLTSSPAATSTVHWPSATNGVQMEPMPVSMSMSMSMSMPVEQAWYHHHHTGGPATATGAQMGIGEEDKDGVGLNGQPLYPIDLPMR